MIPVITWTLEKTSLYCSTIKPTVPQQQFTKRAGQKASNQNPPLMQKKPRWRWRLSSNPKYLQLPLVLDFPSVTPQLTDAFPALGCSLRRGCPVVRCTLLPNQSDEAAQSPPVRLCSLTGLVYSVTVTVTALTVLATKPLFCEEFESKNFDPSLLSEFPLPQMK